MAYGQKNYNEIQGINGKYTIRQIGCFLTAFSNLLERYGRGVDPLTLNRIFRERGIYLDVDDGIRDDLGYQSITAFDGHVVVDRTSSQPSTPSGHDAIVKIKANNNFGTHFCLVNHMDATGVYVVDSWDGQIKNTNVYGPIIGWATYRNIKPQPVIPVTPPAPVDPNRITVQSGWGLSHVLKARGYPQEAFGSETYWQKLAEANGVARWQDFRLSVGQVVNAPAYVAPTPQPEPTPAPQPTPVAQEEKPAEDVPVKVASWQGSDKPVDKWYIAQEDYEVQDLAGLQMKVQLKRGQRVHAVSEFQKDSIIYVRHANAVKNQWWYGIPLIHPETSKILLKPEKTDDDEIKIPMPGTLIDPNGEDDDDIMKDLDLSNLGDEVKELNKNVKEKVKKAKTNFRQKMIAVVAFITGIMKRKNIKKEESK